jgi:hypothetical protein
MLMFNSTPDYTYFTLLIYLEFGMVPFDYFAAVVIYVAIAEPDI